jgi:hypothetical protein
MVAFRKQGRRPHAAGHSVPFPPRIGLLTIELFSKARTGRLKVLHATAWRGRPASLEVVGPGSTASIAALRSGSSCSGPCSWKQAAALVCPNRNRPEREKPRSGRKMAHAVRHDQPASPLVKRVTFDLKLYKKPRPGRCETPRASTNGLVLLPTPFRQGKVRNIDSIDRILAN